MVRDKVRDVVLPVAVVAPGEGGAEMVRFLGTSFLVGDGTFALTAAHVLPQDDAPLAVVSMSDDGWYAHHVKKSECHPTEDLAVLQFESRLWPSWLRLSGTTEHQSLPYRSWGYPENLLYEVVQANRVDPRPDLVYTQGYIRRRISAQLPGLKGRSFFELSEIAGDGCSGSPILRMVTGQANMWDVIGVYVGQRTIEGRDPTRLGYALREEAVRDWVPKHSAASLYEISGRGATTAGSPHRR